MYSNQKKWIALLFSIKSSFKFPALAMPNEVDSVTKDWWRMTSFQEYLKALCFYLACLTSALLCQLQFVCFFVKENFSPLLKQFPELKGFRDSWHDVETHTQTQTLFCTDTRSSSLGVAKAGILKLDFMAKSIGIHFFGFEDNFRCHRDDENLK